MDGVDGVVDSVRECTGVDGAPAAGETQTLPEEQEIGALRESKEA